MFRTICRSDMTPPMAKKTRTDFSQGRDFVQSLARGLSVLRAFDGDHPTLSLAAIAQRTGLSRAAARRLVLTLNILVTSGLTVAVLRSARACWNWASVISGR